MIRKYEVFFAKPSKRYHLYTFTNQKVVRNFPLAIIIALAYSTASRKHMAIIRPHSENPKWRIEIYSTNDVRIFAKDGGDSYYVEDE